MSKKRFLCVIFVIFLAVLGGYRLWTQYQIEHAAQNRYEGLAQQYTETSEKPASETTENTPQKAAVDFDALRTVNPDVIGWIQIPDTKIDYPIVHTSDNETYLHHDFEGKESVSGAIYLDCDSQPDFSGFHNIIYGHHMKNGTMFHDIIKFKDADFFTAHRQFTIYTPDAVKHLQTIAVTVVDGSEGQRRKTQFTDTEALKTYLDTMTADCSFRDLPDGPLETVYSLITCSYEFEDARTILYAAEVSAWADS